MRWSCEGDGVTEGGQPLGVVAGETVGVQPLEVVAPEFTIRLAVPQDVVDDDEDAVGDSDYGLLIAAPLDEAAVLGGEVGVAFPYGAAGHSRRGPGAGCGWRSGCGRSAACPRSHGCPGRGRSRRPHAPPSGTASCRSRVRPRSPRPCGGRR